MGEIKLKKRYKYAGDIFSKLIDIKFDVETATAFLNDIKDADVVEVVRCKNCKRFREYTEEYKATVENADGDCYIRKMCSVDEQFNGVQYDDYCSYGERKVE